MTGNGKEKKAKWIPVYKDVPVAPDSATSTSEVLSGMKRIQVGWDWDNPKQVLKQFEIGLKTIAIEFNCSTRKLG